MYKLHSLTYLLLKNGQITVGSVPAPPQALFIRRQIGLIDVLRPKGPGVMGPNDGVLVYLKLCLDASIGVAASIRGTRRRLEHSMGSCLTL